MTSCLFCRIVAGEIPCRQAWSDDDVLAFHDIAPQAPTHVLVVPRQHVTSLAELAASGPPPSAASLFAGAARAAEALGLNASDGYRLVVNCGERAGQTVMHLHVHLLAGRVFGPLTG